MVGAPLNCSWCNVEVATVRCVDCPLHPSGSLPCYCDRCAQSIHSLEGNLAHRTVPVDAQTPPPSYTSFTSGSINSNIGSYGAPSSPPSVIYVPESYPPSPYVPLYPQMNHPQPQVAVIVPIPVPSNSVSDELTPLVSNHQPVGDILREEDPNKAYACGRVCSLALVLLIISSMIGIVFFTRYVVSGYEYIATIPAILISPLAHGLINAAMLVLGLCALVVSGPRRDFFDCLYKPLLLLPALLYIAGVLLPWLLCRVKDGEYAGAVCSGPYQTLRIPFQIIVLVILSIFMENKLTFFFAAIGSIFVGAGIAMMQWNTNWELSTFKISVAPSLINAALGLIFPLYLVSLRWASKYYRLKQVVISQSLWTTIATFAVYFIWRPEWALSPNEFFNKYVGFFVGMLFIFFFSLLILSFGRSPLIAGLSAFYATTVGFFLACILNYLSVGYQAFGIPYFNWGEEYDWSALHIVGASFAIPLGITLLVALTKP